MGPFIMKLVNFKVFNTHRMSFIEIESNFIGHTQHLPPEVIAMTEFVIRQSYLHAKNGLRDALPSRINRNLIYH